MKYCYNNLKYVNMSTILSLYVNDFIHTQRLLFS